MHDVVVMVIMHKPNPNSQISIQHTTDIGLMPYESVLNANCGHIYGCNTLIFSNSVLKICLQVAIDYLA